MIPFNGRETYPRKKVCGFLGRERSDAEVLAKEKIIPFLKVGALVLYDLSDVLDALKAYKRGV